LKDMQFKLKNGIRPLSTIIPKPPALPLPNYIPECIAPVPMMLEEPFEFGNNGEILPELPEFSCSFEERDFMFFNSQVFSSPPLSRKSKCVGDETPTKQWPAGDEDLDATPTQDSKLGFQFP